MKHDELRFWWGVASGGSRKALRRAQESVKTDTPNGVIDLSEYPVPEDVFLSYTTQNNEPWTGPDWFVDSGGFTFLDTAGEFQTTVREYVRWLAERDLRIDYFALRDFPCEPELLRSTGNSVREHQQFTIRDHVEALEWAERFDLSAEPVAVLQGYDLRDYLWSIDYYRDNGLLTDTVALGSVCARTDTEEIRSIIKQVRDELPERVDLHAFGAKIDILADNDTVAALDSVDTTAWNIRATAAGGGSSGAWYNQIEAYRSYYRQVEALLDAVERGAEVRLTSLASFDSTAAETGEVYPLILCPCGSITDPNGEQITRTGGPCRKCERLALRIWDRRLADGEEVDLPGGDEP